MKRIAIFLVIVLLTASIGFGEQINRYGSTAASFLEIGMGSAPSAMGEAYVAVTGDLSSVYWNPASVAYLKKSSLYQHRLFNN